MEAVDAISFMPGAGSPQAVKNPRLSTLRMRLVPGFHNYLFFYITPDDNAEIIRLLHAAQDRLAILEAEE